jgi:hypothetical protein
MKLTTTSTDAMAGMIFYSKGTYHKLPWLWEGKTLCDDCILKRAEEKYIKK